MIKINTPLVSALPSITYGGLTPTQNNSHILKFNLGKGQQIWNPRLELGGTG